MQDDVGAALAGLQQGIADGTWPVRRLCLRAFPYFLTTFPFIWGSFTSHVCSSIQLPYNIGKVAQTDEGTRHN